MTFNDLCQKLFGRPWPDSAAGANPTIGGGLGLFFIIGVLLPFPGYVPVTIIAMEVIGETAEGRITDHRRAWFNQRSVPLSVFRFRTAEGRLVEGEGFLEGTPLPAVGTPVEVRYLPIWPEELSKYGHHHYAHWGFWLLMVLFLAVFWVWIRVIITTARLVGEKFR